MSDKIDKISINDLLKELICSDDCKIYPWEQLVIFPVANQSQILARGIRDEIRTKNYICAVSLLRNLIESAMILVYNTSIEKENEDEYFKQLVDNGRLRRWSKSEKEWESVRDVHLIKQFKIATGLDIETQYQNACDVLHFSIKHSQFVFVKNTKGPNSSTIEIGESGPKMPQREYEIIQKLVYDLFYIIKTQIAVEIIQKRLKNNEKPSKIAKIVLGGRKIKYK